MPGKHAPLRDRFMALVSPEPNTGCWLWTGATRGVYGAISGERGILLSAHRAAWLLFREENLGERVIRHRCDQPLCVNPSHLESGTQAENIADMMRRGRHIPPRGERNGQAVLTAGQIRFIRRELATGVRGVGVALARQLGVSPATISMIKSGQRWAGKE